MVTFIDVKCEHCGKLFKRSLPKYNYKIKKGMKNYCSIQCANKAKSNSIEKECKHCGKKFLVSKSQREKGRNNFCSLECYYKSKKNYQINEKGNFIEIEIKNKKQEKFIMLLDKEDLEKVRNSAFTVYKHHTGSYYVRLYDRISKKNIPVHRFIMNCPADKVIDHINHNTLDNRKSNLRICTVLENCQNQKLRITNKTGFTYISKIPNKEKWIFSISKKALKYYKTFNSLIKAVKYRDEYLKKHCSNIILKETF